MEAMSRTATVSLLVLLTVVGAGGYFYYSQLGGFSNVSGLIYFSAPNKSGNSSLFSYSPKTASTKTVLSAKNGEKTIINVAVQSDSALIAFTDKDSAQSQTAIRIFDVATKKITEVPAGNFAKRDLSWSPDGTLLAYSKLIKATSTTEERQFAHSWRVFATDLSGKATRITRGVSPVFVSKERLLVIKDDGLYLFSVAPDTEGEKALTIPNGKATGSMRLAVSTDRKLLAWSDPSASKGSLFALDSAGKLTLLKTLAGVYNETVFSPDGRYLALHKTAASSVILYNLSNFRKGLLNLPALSQGNISDWRDK